MEPMMTGTVEEVFERLGWLEGRQDREGWAAPAAYRLCRRVLECWPAGRLVPFICPSGQGDGVLTIDDDEHAVSIRVTPVSVALVTADWTTDAECEQYTSLGRSVLCRVLPGWLGAIDRSELFDVWFAANPDVAAAGSTG